MALVTTIRGALDEATLRKTEHVASDTDDHRVVWTEYCEADCEGPAHRTGTPETHLVFCARHLQHSVHVTMKRWPPAWMNADLGDVG